MFKSIHLNQVSLALVSALLFSRPVWGITLAEAVSFAMKHNRDVLSVQEEIHERRGQVIESRADALPQFNLSMNTFRLRDPGFLNSTFGQELLKGGGTGVEEMPFPIEAIMPKPQSFYEMTMNVSQPLFAWGKVSNAYKLATLGIKDSKLNLERTRQLVAYQVTSAYYDMLLAEETIAMYEKAIETQRRYLKQTRDFFEVGDGTRLDILRAESQLATTEPDLFQANHALAQAKKNLNFLLGRNLDQPVSASPVEMAGEFSAPALDSVISVAVTNRPDLSQLKVQVDMYDKSINVFKADFRPRADLVGHYGFSTINTDDLLDRNFESWRVSLEIKIPVFDGLRNRGVVMQNKSLKNRKEIEREKLAEQIRLQARQATDACNSAAKVYRGRQLSLVSSEEEERVTSDQFDQGLVTLYELLDSNRRTLLVRNQSIQARYSLLREIANLKQVMGIPVEEWY